MGGESCGAETRGILKWQSFAYNSTLEIPVSSTRPVKLDCLGQFLEAGIGPYGLYQALPLNLEAEVAKKQPCFP